MFFNLYVFTTLLYSQFYPNASIRGTPSLSHIRNLLITSETVIILPDLVAFTRFQTAKGDLNEIAFCCCEWNI